MQLDLFSDVGEKYYHNKRIRSEGAFLFNDSREVAAVEDPSVRLQLVKAHGEYSSLRWLYTSLKVKAKG